ncbi:F-box only protein 22-like isoform X3 [Varroa jacobsoni]|uniref:F-box only protein 22-like isoform X3 n=1 Tax=Varroa jacobsoni TaxID=62625 RepID=UPI000BF8DB5B|nr:F-box only protein 22-like isoform X3 [Varroa jacobsoni]
MENEQTFIQSGFLERETDVALFQVSMELRHRKRARLQNDCKLAEDEKWIGNVLTSNPVIVKHLMRFLTAKQLSRAVVVCSLWRECALKEKLRRFEIQQFGFTVHHDNGEELPPFGTSRPSDVGNHFYQVTENLRAEPRVVFIFTTQKVVSKAVKYFEDFSSTPAYFRATAESLKRTKRHVYSVGLCNHLSTLLPRTSEIFLCTSWGMICWNKGLGPIEIEDCDGFSTLFLPNMPDVQFTSFRLLQQDCATSLRDDYLSEISGLSQVHNIAALVLYANEMPDGGSAPARLVDYTIRRNPGMALGGALVCDFSVPVDGVEREVVNMTGLAIHGQGVRAASVLLDPDCRGREKVRARLAVVGDQFQLTPGRSVALLFACSGRGVHFHLAQNVESSIFSELFPGVPVVGLFGNGEFGYDSLGGRGTPGRSRQWQHSYTSVFVLLNFEPTSGRISPEESSVPSEGHH